MAEATTSSPSTGPQGAGQARSGPGTAPVGKPAQPLKRTPLYQVHAALGAKIIPFARARATGTEAELKWGEAESRTLEWRAPVCTSEALGARKMGRGRANAEGNP